MPPIPEVTSPSPLPAVFNAAWGAVLEYNGQFEGFAAPGSEDVGRAVRAISGLALKGVEAAQVAKWWAGDALTERDGPGSLELTRDATVSAAAPAAVLTKVELRRKVEDTASPIVTPILDPDQIGDGSINLRLGTHFIVAKAPDLPYFDPSEMGERDIRHFQEHVGRSFGDRFVRHPHRLVLGVTFEYIALPDDLAALVLSRSSYGRIGLIVATATFVHPGWKGCLTLELSNAADVPLELRCGSPIAQLVVFRADQLSSTGVRRFPHERTLFPILPEFSTFESEEAKAELEKLRAIAEGT